MYEKDGIPKDDVVRIVDEFPNQSLDFYGALRSCTYDRSISKWIDEIGGVEKLGDKLLRRKKNEKLPVFTPPKFMDLCKVFFPLFQTGGKGREVRTNCKPSLTGENIY
ncbi:ribulose bisphosphate carboxylase/oxygenase activase 2, chloroplastic-like isoform X1 [Castanea sativa]|uniref:ribulose bisphosphate carboxylase/oxygenase activase 2, chloroplastic-like isoform X1 n=1 Tax=Castanea sativa TaxID=21020 RepID=UPI003F64F87D